VTRDEAYAVLTRLEANNWADLYRSRWDSAFAAMVVPELVGCFEVDEVGILLRSLSALHRIGQAAHSAGDFIIPLLGHVDGRVQQVAVHTLSSVCYRDPQKAVPPLVRAAQNPLLLKDAMFALIYLGHGANSAKHVFIGAFAHRQGRIRRLAIRGLKQIGAEGEDVMAVLYQAVNDKNSKVKEYATRLLQERLDVNLQE
jgi:HEAT repeat protein